MLIANFYIILALSIMGLTYVTAIHRLLISKRMSDKLYKNFGLAILCFGVYVNCGVVIISSGECRWMIAKLKAGNLPFKELNDLVNNLISSLNQMSISIIASIAFCGLMMLLIKSIEKDIDKDFEKPKYRWGLLKEKTTN